MKTIKYVIVLCCINFSFASAGGGFFEQWFMPDTALFLWSVITFLIVLGILRWKAWGPLMDTLDARAKQIEESLSKAETVAIEAKEQAKENEKILAQAREEANQIIADAKKAGEKLKNKLSEEGQEKYVTLISNAKSDIKSAKDKALNDIKTMVVDISLEASEKIIKRNLNTEDNKNIIEETVKSFQEKN